MASIKPYKTGWRVWVCVQGRKASKTFASKREAAAWGLAQEACATPLVSGRQTLHQAMEKFEQEESPKRAGARWEVVRLRKLRRELKDTPLRDLSAQALSEWRDAMVKVRAPSSVRREMNLLNSVLEVARKEWGWLETNPLRDVRKPPNAKARKRGLRQSEIDAIVQALGWEPWLRAERRADEVAIAFLLGVETAMRSGEMLSLRWSDVDLEGRVVLVRDTKNGDDREVPLSTTAVKLLRCLPAGERCFSVSGAVRDVLFREARDAAGVSDVHFHDSRSEGISRLAKVLDVLDLARVSGHRDLKSLMHYYRATVSELAKKLG